MKNKTVIILLSVLAVALYTVAVINFCIAIPGSILDGIGQALTACGLLLMAFSLVMMGRVGHLSSITAKALGEFMEMLSKGVPATLTIKGNKGTLELNPDEDEDGGDAPEEELTEQEKRVKRIAEEYDELRGRFDEMTHFRDTEAYKQMPDNKRVLYDRQCKAMDDYESALRERIRIEAKEANLKIDIEEPDTETAE